LQTAQTLQYYQRGNGKLQALSSSARGDPDGGATVPVACSPDTVAHAAVPSLIEAIPDG
jgi:hypothetical protein